MEESLAAEQMRKETAERMRDRVTLWPLPLPTELAALVADAGLSKAISAMDRLIFATAVHFSLSVVTVDKRLAGALKERNLLVWNTTLVFEELVGVGNKPRKIVQKTRMSPRC